MKEFEICLVKKYWKFVKVEAESYKEAIKIALRNEDEPPHYIGNWVDYNNSISVDN